MAVDVVSDHRRMQQPEIMILSLSPNKDNYVPMVTMSSMITRMHASCTYPPPNYFSIMGIVQLWLFFMKNKHIGAGPNWAGHIA